MAKKVQIIISNENGQYNLGTVDTSEIESMLYDQKLNDAVVSLVSEKKYQEALDLLDSATETVTRWGSTYKVWKDAESANFYGYDELIKDCTFRMYYEPAMELHELGQNIEAITQLRKLKEVNRDLYDANKCDELVKEWQALAIGPAGGFIFYDKGFYSDGWRYLEAAPSDLKGKYAFCSQQKYIYKAYVGEDGEIFKNRYYEYGVDYKDNYNYADEYELKLIEISKEEYEADIENLSWGGSGKTKYFAASKYPIDLKTSDSIGSGKENTEKILTVYGEDAPAAYAVSLYSVNGFDDWFLPSKEEGNLMLSAIGYNGIGGFRDEEGTRVTIENAKNRSYELVYVSSTQASWDLGSQDLIGSTHSWMEYEYRVRPIRAF